MNHADKALERFHEGYNCAQAVALAFCDLTGMEEKAAARMASSFGGGIGRMREVCGAVSGMYMVLGILYGYDDPADNAGKKALYQDIQALAEKFRGEHGSIICRDLLKNPPSDPNPTLRSPEFYKMRPCDRMVYTAAELMEYFIAEHPLED